MKNRFLLAAFIAFYSSFVQASGDGTDLPGISYSKTPPTPEKNPESFENGISVTRAAQAARNRIKDELLDALKKSKEGLKPKNISQTTTPTPSNINSKVGETKVERVPTKEANLVDSIHSAIPVRPGSDGVVSIRGDVTGTYIVEIAKGFLNIVETPFQNPLSKTVNDIKIDVDKSGMFVYTDSDDASGVIIWDRDKPNLKVSIVFVPKRIEPRKINIWFPAEKLERVDKPDFIPARTDIKPINSKIASKWERSGTYESKLIDIVDIVSDGRAPPGYKVTKHNRSEVGYICGSTKIIGEKKISLEGEAFIVDVYKVSNESSFTELLPKESNCYVKGTAAISFYPSRPLYPGLSAEMYIVISKDAIKEKKRSGVYKKRETYYSK